MYEGGEGGGDEGREAFESEMEALRGGMEDGGGDLVGEEEGGGEVGYGGGGIQLCGCGRGRGNRMM